MSPCSAHPPPTPTPALAALPPNASATADIDGVPTLAIHTDFDLYRRYPHRPHRPLTGAPPRLQTPSQPGGATPITAPALDLLRIQRGIPPTRTSSPKDYNPLEAGLWEFISFNMGCYIGQEVVARLNAYDKIQRHLVRLSWQRLTHPRPNPRSTPPTVALAL